MLISEPYRQEQAALHAANKDYGSASITMAPLVERVARACGATSVLDYGAGKCRLVSAAPGLPGYRAFDPAIPGIDLPPEPADLVVCIDVLEHIEPDCLDAVLDHLAGLSQKYLLASVATGPSRRSLGDGRNAHLIQQPPEWWLPKLWARAEVTAFNLLPNHGFWMTARPRHDVSDAR